MNSTSIPFTASSAAAPAGGGGGGGNVIIESAGACEFNIVKPTNGFINARCPKGQVSESFSIVLYNAQPTTQDYQIGLENVNCQLDETAFSIAGKSQHSVMVSKCACPTNETITGSVMITNGACTADVPIQLYNTALARLLGNHEFLWRALLAIAIALGLAIAVKYL